MGLFLLLVLCVVGLMFFVQREELMEVNNKLGELFANRAAHQQEPQQQQQQQHPLSQQRHVKQESGKKDGPLVDEAHQLFTSKCKLRDLTGFDKFVVTSKAVHDTTWVKKMKLPYLLFDKMVEPFDEKNYFGDKENTVKSPFNCGKEVSTYLQFIVEYYDCLPLRYSPIPILHRSLSLSLSQCVCPLEPIMGTSSPYIRHLTSPVRPLSNSLSLSLSL